MKINNFLKFLLSHSVAEFFDEVNDKFDCSDLAGYGKLDFTQGINANVYRRILGVKERNKPQQPKSPEIPPPSEIQQDGIQVCKKFVSFQGLQQQGPYAIPTSVISGGKRAKNSTSINLKIPKLPEATSNSESSSECEYLDDDEFLEPEDQGGKFS